MADVDIKYPALHAAADAASNKSQKSYLSLLRGEYATLFVAAVMGLEFNESATYFVCYALVFVVSAIVVLYRSANKPEQAWYKCRALAESVKTSAWRYMMRAEPFNSRDIDQDAAQFRNFLRAILESNRHIGEKIAGLSASGDQITSEMKNIRSRTLADRIVVYQSNRIDDQRIWYANKAAYNNKLSKFWVCVSILVYFLAAASALLRIEFHEFKYFPTDPLIVIASSIVGWMQIKKYNELASAYTLTAHELGIVRGELEEIKTEDQFSRFVNDSELAISREHTQWVARQPLA